MTPDQIKEAEELCGKATEIYERLVVRCNFGTLDNETYVVESACLDILPALLAHIRGLERDSVDKARAWDALHNSRRAEKAESALDAAREVLREARPAVEHRATYDVLDRRGVWRKLITRIDSITGGGVS